jgi:hypothetical protein
MATNFQQQAVSPVAAPVAAVSNEGYLARKMTTLADANPTAVYTAGAANTRQVHVIQTILVTNPTGGAVTATLTVYQSSNTTVYEFYPATSLAAKGRLPFPSDGAASLNLVLEPSDEIRLTGNGLTAIVVARIHQGNTK